MDRLTSVQIELMCESAIGLDSNKTERLWTRLKAEALRDLALQSLSQEAVRDEVLEEAVPEHYEAALRQNEKLRDMIRSADSDAGWLIESLKECEHALGQVIRTGKVGWLQETAYETAVNVLKREPNAAAQMSLPVRMGREAEADSRQVESATSARANPAPAALSEARCPLCKPFMIHWEAERRRILQTPCKRRYCPIKIASAQIAAGPGASDD